MAQTNASGPQKRPAVTRRNRAAALEKARQEQMAKDQRHATIIGAVVVIIVLLAAVLIGVSVWRANHPASSSSQSVTLSQAKANVEKVETKPTNLDGNWGYLISKNGINKPIKNVPTITLYMDFMCPACGTYERSVDSTLSKMYEAGQVNLELFPMGFLDASSTDQYSTRSASAMAYVAQHEPQHLFSAIQAMYEEDFQPQEAYNYKPVSNAKIAAQLEKGGVSHAVAQASVKGTYTDWIKAMRVYVPLTTRTQHPSGEYKGKMTTPTVLVNNTYLDDLQTGDSGVSQLLGAIGLDQGSVGKAGTLPKLGTSAKLPGD